MVTTPEEIRKHKEELGYDPDPNFTIFVETTGKVSLMLGPITSKTYAISFEKDGLLFMGHHNITNKWNDSNFFIPLNKIGNLQLTKTRFLNGRLLLNAHKLSINNLEQQKTDVFIAYDYLVGKPWIRAGFENVKKRIAEYPPMAERTKIVPDDKGSSAAYIDEIAKLKQLLDSGALTQEEFESKKKQLLNL